MNEERQGGDRISWMQPLVQEAPDQQVTKRQEKMGEGKLKCHRRKSIFSIPYFFPSLSRQVMILVKVEFLSEPE